MKKIHGLELLHYCGGGAFGEVYYCRDLSGREMAVKIVSKQKLGDAWQRELKGVINYGRITENAKELLQIFHAEDDAECFYYTMEAADSVNETEYIPDTLAGRLQHGPLPQEKLYEILYGIFTGIKTIHDAGFAHRDIKPENILFVKGVPKLGDIGLVSSLSATVSRLAGTMDFIPPELRIADGSDSSDRLSRKRNDLYAFGKVVYCAATGLEPHSWPAVPKDVPLSLALKLFLRLSFRLCAKDPVGRLDSVEELQEEFAAIERKLKYGETLRDKFGYQFREFRIRNFRALSHGRDFVCRHWLAVCTVVLLSAGGLWYLWPEPPFDIAEVTTKKYKSDAGGFTITIPKQWEVLNNAIIQKKISGMNPEKYKKLSPIQKKRLEFFLQFLKYGVEMIYCDFDEHYQDNITIQSMPLPGEKLMEQSDAELLMTMRKVFQGELKFKTEVYELKRSIIDGVHCVIIDFSHEPQKNRVQNYLFLMPSRCITVTLITKRNTFLERKEQFTQVIRTLKFDKKAVK